MLGLGEPVGLDDDGLRARPGEIDAARVVTAGGVVGMCVVSDDAAAVPPTASPIAASATSVVDVLRMVMWVPSWFTLGSSLPFERSMCTITLPPVVECHRLVTRRLIQPKNKNTATPSRQATITVAISNSLSLLPVARLST